MVKFSLAQLVNAEQPIELLEVLSFEMNIYLVQVTVGGQTGMVYQGERPQRFTSTGHIREAFAECEVAQAVMVHDTPYDEMINNPPKARYSMALPFSMSLPY